MVQRALQQIFAHVDAQPEREFLLAISMLEIYNEVVPGPSGHCTRGLHCRSGRPGLAGICQIAQCTSAARLTRPRFTVAKRLPWRNAIGPSWHHGHEEPGMPVTNPPQLHLGIRRCGSAILHVRWAAKPCRPCSICDVAGMLRDSAAAARLAGPGPGHGRPGLLP